MKDRLTQTALCVAAILAFAILGIIAGPGVIVAVVIQELLAWEDRYRDCHCHNDSPSAFAVVGFLVLWVPWVFFLCTAFDSWWYMP